MDSHWSDHSHAISAVGSTTTGYYPSTAGVPTEGATSVLVHVTSASTSSATVVIQGSVDGAFWHTLATIADPTLLGEMWAGPASRYIRLGLTVHASGTISGSFCFRAMQADPIGSSWKKLVDAANSFGALSVTALTDSGLTATYVPYSGTGGLLKDASTLVFTEGSGTLSATILKATGLTSTYIPYSVSGVLTGAST